MKQTATREEIDALEREIREQQNQRERRVRHAVNPGR